MSQHLRWQGLQFSCAFDEQVCGTTHGRVCPAVVEIDDLGMEVIGFAHPRPVLFVLRHFFVRPAVRGTRDLLAHEPIIERSGVANGERNRPGACNTRRIAQKATPAVTAKRAWRVARGPCHHMMNCRTAGVSSCDPRLHRAHFLSLQRLFESKTAGARYRRSINLPVWQRNPNCLSMMSSVG